MNKAVRGAMLERRVLAKVVAVLCACGSAGIVLPAMASTTVTTYTYDAGDHVTTVTDPRGLITVYNYDGLGQLWGVSSPDTGTTTASYDAYGRRSSLTRANNVTTTYGYDALNRLTTISAGGQTQTFAYDSCTHGVGRLCTVSDAAGSTAYSYTPEGWIAGRGFSIAGTAYSLGYGYDAMGHLATVTYPDGDQAAYSYSDGVVSGLTFTIGGTPLTAASGVTWQPMNAALASWTSGNGLANTLSYDADGRLTAINTPGVESLGFSYDTANRMAGIDNALDGTMSQDFDYDDQSRLVAAYSGSVVASYGYDADGNRITSVQGGTSNSTGYSATSNRIVSTTGTNPQTYGYDALGNITTLGGVTVYQYDAFNRMSAAGGMSYYVNPEGQRLRKSGSLGTTYFAPDASGPLLAENDSGAWIDYLWLGGRLIGREVNGQLEAIGDDQVGRPQVVTNASQVVVWSAQNWPFTQAVTVSNSAPLNLGFPGQYYDVETGLWNNGFRDYDSTLGRYVESDPLGLNGGVNTYAYVGGNPLTNIDPYGLWTLQLGFSLQYSLTIPGTSIGISGMIGIGAAFDSHGQIAPYFYVPNGPGGSIGTNGGSAGVQVEVSNADTVYDLAGPFTNIAASGGDGMGGSLDGFWGKDHTGCQNVIGGGLTLGGGVGANAFMGPTTTTLGPVGHLW
ncbi:RHS repeat-associated core domain-containing protein [Rhodanobacter sp. Si-c]|uniref:RHS repeat-associated core domain-containing protein n=1 Tax=Rhodanobacter lycopersici TaxID=3162487 RepID=A0ABV3QJ16_9GAMM